MGGGGGCRYRDGHFTHVTGIWVCVCYSFTFIRSIVDLDLMCIRSIVDLMCIRSIVDLNLMCIRSIVDLNLMYIRSIVDLDLMLIRSTVDLIAIRSMGILDMACQYRPKHVHVAVPIYRAMGHV